MNGMKISIKIAVTAAALAAAAYAPAQETGRAITLDEAIAVTLTENPAMKAAAYEERAAQQQAAAASRSQSRESLTTTTTTPSPSGTGGAAVAQYALQFRGYPYVYGGNTPAGWDCSGFVQYVFSQFGVSLPRTSGAMMSVGSPVGSLAEAQPGDILATAGHAAIYIGNGRVMNAMTAGSGTDTAWVSRVFSGGGYAIRRVI